MIPASKRPRFLLDLADELTWLSQNAGAEAAERWYQALKETIRFLQQHPLVGRERTDLKPDGIRSWRIKQFPRWLIFYSVQTNKQIVLLRVRPGNMNLIVLEMES